MITPERLAKLFHEKYEEVFREESSLPSGSRGWDEIPTMTRRRFYEVAWRVLMEIDEEDLTRNKWR